MRLSSLFFVSLIIDCSVWRDLIYTEPLGFGRSKINHIAEDATASRKQRPDVGSYFPRHVCPSHRMTLAIFSSVGKRGSRGIITPTRNPLVSEKSFRLDSIRFFRFFHRQSIFLVLLAFLTFQQTSCQLLNWRSSFLPNYDRQLLTISLP